MSEPVMTASPVEPRGVCRIELSSEPVTLRGEPLSEIWWRGRQWAVTSYGIECLDGLYFIEKKQLSDNSGEYKYTWAEHVGRKGWADPDEFATAWMIALLLHGYGRKNSGQIRKSFGRLPPVGRHPR